VYRTRLEKFHWDLETTFELNGKYKLQLTGNDPDVGEEVEMLDASLNVAQDLEYNVNEFVAITGQGCSLDGVPFWLGRINELESQTDGSICSLNVTWYEAYGKGTPWTAKYRPTIVPGSKSRNLWRGTAAVSTVLAKFDSLTTTKKISTGAVKKIRESLGIS